MNSSPTRASDSSAGRCHTSRRTPEDTSRSTMRGAAALVTANATRRAAEGVGALPVVGAHPHDDVPGGQLDITAVGAAGPDGRHRHRSSSGGIRRTGPSASRCGPLSAVRASAVRAEAGGGPGWAPMPMPLPSLLVPPIGFAHRGARTDAPENTIEAFTLALRLGAQRPRERRRLADRRRGSRPRPRRRVPLGLASAPDRRDAPGRPPRPRPHPGRALRRLRHRCAALTRRQGPGGRPPGSWPWPGRRGAKRSGGCGCAPPTGRWRRRGGSCQTT